MRTTLDIDDDLIAAAKKLARRQGATAGQAVPSLLRQSLTRQATPLAGRRSKGQQGVAGIEPFAAKPGVVTTNDHVNALRDSEGV